MDLSYDNKKLLKIYYDLPIFIREWIAIVYSLKVRRRRYGGVFSAQFNELIRNEKLTLEERLEIQLSSLREMLIYTNKTTPYYRELFSSIGFNPHIHSLDDIRKIPSLEKEILRTQHDQFLAEDFKEPTMKNHTSGTTGSALELAISEEANQRHYACSWFHFGWAGVKRGDRIVTFGGHPISAMKRMSPPFWLYDRNENELMFSAYHLTPKTIPYYVEELIKFNPVMIRGYPSIVYLIALHLLETDKQMTIRPKGIFTYAETMLEKQRQTIEQAFDCPVYSSYGNGERTGNLLQCQEGNFHIVTETCVVEVIRSSGEPAKPGEMGELVITSITNKAMPMIRYRVGDVAIQAAGLCECGRTSPIVKEITGRIEDFIITPDGRHLGRLDKIFLSTPNIKEAQLVQEEIDKLQVNIVTRPGYTERDEKLLLDRLHSHLGDEMEIRFQIVDEIPRTPQGKFKFIISKVPIQFQASE